MKQLKERVQFILQNEGVIYRQIDLRNYIEEFFIDNWDIRKLINEIQGNVSVDGNLMALYSDIIYLNLEKCEEG